MSVKVLSYQMKRIDAFALLKSNINMYYLLYNKLPYVLYFMLVTVKDYL